MAKKKSKHNKSNADGVAVLNNPMGQAGTVLIGTIVAEILSVALDRLLQKVNNSNSTNETDHGTDRPTSFEIEDSEQSEDEDQHSNLGGKSTVRDAVETAKSVVEDAPSGMAQVVDAVKERIPAIASSVMTSGSLAQLTVGDVVDTAKTVVSALGNATADKLQPEAPQFEPVESQKPHKKKAKKKHKK